MSAVAFSIYISRIKDVRYAVFEGAHTRLCHAQVFVCRKNVLLGAYRAFDRVSHVAAISSGVVCCLGCLAMFDISWP